MYYVHLSWLWWNMKFTLSVFDMIINWRLYFDGILPKGPYRHAYAMADRALLAGYPRFMMSCHPFLWFFNLHIRSNAVTVSSLHMMKYNELESQPISKTYILTIPRCNAHVDHLYIEHTFITQTDMIAVVINNLWMLILVNDYLTLLFVFFPIGNCERQKK